MRSPNHVKPAVGAAPAVEDRVRVGLPELVQVSQIKSPRGLASLYRAILSLEHLPYLVLESLAWAGDFGPILVVYLDTYWNGVTNRKSDVLVAPIYVRCVPLRIFPLVSVRGILFTPLTFCPLFLTFHLFDLPNRLVAKILKAFGEITHSCSVGFGLTYLPSSGSVLMAQKRLLCQTPMNLLLHRTSQDPHRHHSKARPPQSYRPVRRRPKVRQP